MRIKVKLNFYILITCNALKALCDRRFYSGKLWRNFSAGSALYGHFFKPFAHHLFIGRRLQTVHIAHLAVEFCKPHISLFALLRPQPPGTVIRNQRKKWFFAIANSALKLWRNRCHFLRIYDCGPPLGAMKLSFPCNLLSAQWTGCFDCHWKLRLQFNNASHIITFIERIIFWNAISADIIKACQESTNGNRNRIKKRWLSTAVVTNDHR